MSQTYTLREHKKLKNRKKKSPSSFLFLPPHHVYSGRLITAEMYKLLLQIQSAQVKKLMMLIILYICLASYGFQNAFM